MSVMVKRAFAFGVAIILTACGGGGDGGGFLPEVVEPELTIVTSDLPSVTQIPYATVIDVTGGAGGYTWSLVSDGGTGYTLDEDGVLRGDTLLALGTYGITVRVEDSNGLAAERSFTLLIETQVLDISSTALPDAEEGVPYSTVLEAAGGSTPYSWLLLDDGDTDLTITSAGVLSGTPPSPGTYGFTFVVEDASGTQARRSLTLDVTSEIPPLSIATNALPQIAENERYAAVVSAEGGTGDYAWTLVSSGGSGFSLTSAGVLTGTAPSAGIYGLTFAVDDGVSQVTRSLTVTVTDDDTPLTIETDSLPDGVTGTSYAAVISATGGTGNYSWALLDGGSSGLSLTSNGVVRGVPFTAGSFGITVRVNDGQASVVRSLVVNLEQRPTDPSDIPDALIIATDSLPSTAPGERYATVVSAEGGTGTYTYTLVSDGGTGLSLSASGVLSGTAPAAGVYGLSFSVNDGATTASRSLTLAVVGDGPSALTITTQTLPGATSGTQYAAVLSATGGEGAYTWSLPNGGGVTGLTINSAGVLSGVAGPAGSYGLTISVTDDSETVTESFTLEIAGSTEPAPLTIVTDALPDAVSGTLYAATIEASGGSGPYTWSLPNDGGTGLTIDNTGALRGTAPFAGVYALSVSVSDGTNTTNASVTLTVTGGEAPTITTESLPEAVTGESYVAVIEASGGIEGSYVWTVVNDGGSGLTFSENVLGGTAPAEGTYGLTLQVSDGANTSRRSFVLTVASSTGGTPLSITNTSLLPADVNTSYVAVLEAQGGTGSYTWSLLDDGGTGLAITAAGVLSGTVATEGTYGLTFQVGDGSSTATQSLILSVEDGDTALSIATETLPDASGNVYGAVLQAAGGVRPYTWDLVDDPNNSQFIVSVDGVLSGLTPPPGVYPITVTVTDATSTVVTRGLSVTVANAQNPPVEIITSSLPSGSVGQFYATVVRGTGGDGDEYTWTLEGVVPAAPGLTLTPSSGVLTWSNSDISAGVYTLTISLQSGESSNPDSADTADLILTVN